ncbi:unnamed protein product, partial [Aureobasidium vineae]
TITKMQSTRSEPYITAVLHGAQTELDLSGSNSFSLTISLTLHAEAPVICYLGDDDNFFVSDNALADVGIVLLSSESGLHLKPNIPITFDIPFNGSKQKQGDSSFDIRLYMVAHGFETGGTYEAALQTGRKIFWWRYASFWETEGQQREVSAITAGVRAAVKSAVSWWTGDKECEQGVPVLPREQQMPIYIEGENVVFSCVGKLMEWPIPDEEAERKMAGERREVKEKRSELARVP